ncbi:hypothetical protein Tco_0436699 [Tanacetum coccineum]
MLTTRNPIKLGDPMQQIFHRLLLLSWQVVQIVLWYLDSGCSKHMTGNRSQLINFGMDITQKDEKRSQNGKPNMEWKRL